MKAPKPNVQRRKNDRIQWRAYGTLEFGEEKLAVHLLNFSLAGALVAVTDSHDLQIDSQTYLKIGLNDDQQLTLDARVAHIKDHFIGLDCKAKCSEDQDLLNELIKKLQDDEAIHTDS